MLDPTPWTGPIVVTLAYVLVYYATQVNVVRVKVGRDREYAAKGEKFDRYFGDDRVMLAADRIQLNLLEHMGPFLVLLWLNAAFVGVRSATVAGAVYVGARTLYPFLMGERLGRGVRARIWIATVPGYLVLAWFAGALTWALVAGR